MSATKDIQGKKIVVTGASSGIGRAAALQLAAKGAVVLLVARRATELQAVVEEIRNAGGSAQAYIADLSDLDAVDELGERLLAEHKKIDVLVNNAGRSIRRPLMESLDRYHDFERCMQLNYFSPVRLMRKLLPAMIEAGDGHIINSSTWGTLMPSKNFGPYNASKAALDSLARSMRMELRDKGIAITQIHFPLVHTPMSAATKVFTTLPGMTPESAGRWIVKAVIKQPSVIMDAKTSAGWHVFNILPKLAETISAKLPF